MPSYIYVATLHTQLSHDYPRWVTNEWIHKFFVTLYIVTSVKNMRGNSIVGVPIGDCSFVFRYVWF